MSISLEFSRTIGVRPPAVTWLGPSYLQVVPSNTTIGFVASAVGGVSIVSVPSPQPTNSVTSGDIGTRWIPADIERPTLHRLGGLRLQAVTQRSFAGTDQRIADWVIEEGLMTQSARVAGSNPASPTTGYVDVDGVLVQRRTLSL